MSKFAIRLPAFVTVTLMALAIVVVLGYYGVGLVAMFQGLSDLMHPVLVILLVIASLFFGFGSLLFSVGFFWGAYAVWGLAWPWALLLAVPSLGVWVFIVVGLGSITLSSYVHEKWVALNSRPR